MISSSIVIENICEALYSVFLLYLSHLLESFLDETVFFAMMQKLLNSLFSNSEATVVLFSW